METVDTRTFDCADCGESTTLGIGVRGAAVPLCDACLSTRIQTEFWDRLGVDANPNGTVARPLEISVRTVTDPPEVVDELLAKLDGLRGDGVRGGQGRSARETRTASLIACVCVGVLLFAPLLYVIVEAIVKELL